MDWKCSWISALIYFLLGMVRDNVKTILSNYLRIYVIYMIQILLEE